MDQKTDDTSAKFIRQLNSPFLSRRKDALDRLLALDHPTVARYLGRAYSIPDRTDSIYGWEGNHASRSPRRERIVRALSRIECIESIDLLNMIRNTFDRVEEIPALPVPGKKTTPPGAA
jgi:hypothetical protein